MSDSERLGSKAGDDRRAPHATGDPDDALAIAIARDLIGEPPRPEEIVRWRQAIEARGAFLSSERDLRLWRLIRSAPWLIGAVEVGLAHTDPHSTVRHRIYLMLAVLEASPHHTRHFLPRETGPLALLALLPRMILAAMRIPLGVVLVRTLTPRQP